MTHILKDGLTLCKDAHNISQEIKQIADSGHSKDLLSKLQERERLLEEISKLQVNNLGKETIGAIKSLLNSILSLDEESKALVTNRRDRVIEQLERVETARKHLIHIRRRRMQKKRRLVDIIR